MESIYKLYVPFMVRHRSCLGVCVVIPGGCHGTEKQISTAKENVKKGSNLENAEQTMCTLLKDSANRNNTKIWSVLFDALKKQYEQANEKIYLKQQYDTANLFNIASRMYQQMEAFDSIDAMPDEKGRVKLTMRKVNADFLNRLRPNLFSGGISSFARRNMQMHTVCSTNT